MPMFDVTSGAQVSAQWQSFVQPIARLFQCVPIAKGRAVLVMLASEEARSAVCAAVHALEGECVELAFDAAPAEVEQAILRQQPVVVVCAPEIFGWVSKIAFVARSSAIYTCGENGEGTLLARAAHFVE